MMIPMIKYKNFEYGGNHKLRRILKSWDRKVKCTGIVIVGETCSGKTVLMNELSHKLENVLYLTGEQFIECIYAGLKNGTLSLANFMKEYKTVLLDGIDQIAIGSETKMHIVCRMLKEVFFEKEIQTRLICTFINYSIANDFAKVMGYKLIEMKNVKPSAKLVKEHADKYVVDLTKSEIKALTKSKNIFEMCCRMNRIKILQSLRKKE